MGVLSVRKILLPQNNPQLFAKLPKILRLPFLFVDIMNKYLLRPTFKNPMFESEDELRKAKSQFEFH